MTDSHLNLWEGPKSPWNPSSLLGSEGVCDTLPTCVTQVCVSELAHHHGVMTNPLQPDFIPKLITIFGRMLIVYPQRIRMACACFGLASISDVFAEVYVGAGYSWRYTNARRDNWRVFVLFLQTWRM